VHSETGRIRGCHVVVEAVVAGGGYDHDTRVAERPESVRQAYRIRAGTNETTVNHLRAIGPRVIQARHQITGAAAVAIDELARHDLHSPGHATNPESVVADS